MKEKKPKIEWKIGYVSNFTRVLTQEEWNIIYNNGKPLKYNKKPK
jgi:hypothetical protein